MSLLTKASLITTPTAYDGGVLNSVKPTSGDGDFDFARASGATRVNEQGLIEKERGNLILQSNQFDTTWGATRATLTGGQSGYDGSNDAWAFIDTADNSTHLINQSFSLGSSVATFSVYAKAGSRDFLSIRFEGSTVDYAYFNLSSGTLGTIDSDYIEARIVSIGSGWYRCEVTRTLPASGNQVVLLSADANNDPTYAGSGDTAIYIQDAQLEQGLVATDYIETTTAAVYEGITDNIPRINYENSIGNFLLEGQRTNIVTHSEYLDALAKTGMTITANATTSPEGVDNAVKIAYTSSTSYIAGGTSLTTGVDHTFSAFFKPDETNYVIINQGGASATNATYNFADGTHSGGAGITTDMIDYGNGWYRVVYMANLTFNALRIYMSGNGSYGNYPAAGEGFFAYGFQLEASAIYPTSYIPTYGASVTRVAETCNNAGDSSLFNDSEGVLYAEVAALFADGTSRRIALSDGSTSNRIVIENDETSGRYRFFISGGGTTVELTNVTGITETNFNKIAVYWNGVNSKIFFNGTQNGSTVTSTPTISGLSTLQLEQAAGGASYFYGKTKMVSTFTEALSDSELECLTSWSSFNRMATAQNYTIE
jgi:hypothetical protein